MHTTLYRKWRPDTFSSVVGQEAVTDVLRYEVQNGKTTHAYLFCGSRGTGKTSCAKILAKAINCLSPVDGNPCGKCEACLAVESGNCTDIIEMDAASNTGVDYIRDIREDVQFPPSTLKKKVYIVDEVHMLSSSAFNAFLKTLEEPPEHIVFIFATTEFHKLPVTIVSRCQRFDFKRIPLDGIMSRISFIAKEENINITPDAVKQIALMSKGGMRDAISLFELCASTGKDIDSKLVSYTLGVPDRKKLSALVSCVLSKNTAGIFRGVNSFVLSTPDVSVFWQELIDFYRDMLVVTVSDTAAEILEITGEEYEETKKTASYFTKEKLIYHMSLLENAYFEMQRSPLIRRSLAEMTLIRMSDDTMGESLDALVSRISVLEKAIKNGVCVPKSEQQTEDVPAERQDETGETEFDAWAEALANLPKECGLQMGILKSSHAYIKNGDFVISLNYDPGTIVNDSLKPALADAIRETGAYDGITANKIVFDFGYKESTPRNGDLNDLS